MQIWHRSSPGRRQAAKLVQGPGQCRQSDDQHNHHDLQANRAAGGIDSALPAGEDRCIKDVADVISDRLRAWDGRVERHP